MNHFDRRRWLKTAGLSTGLFMFNGLDAIAANYKPRSLDIDGIIQLNANENPYSPSKRIQQTIIDNFEFICRYPFRIASGLKTAIAEKEGVSEDHIVITGGSTEGLRAAGLVYGQKGSEIIAADPTFQTLLRYAENFDVKIHRVPVDVRLKHDLKAMSDKVNDATSLIFVCNPNNPTGTIVAAEELIDFCTSHDSKAVIFCDEAYFDFITEPNYPSMVDLVKKDRNIIVSRTFSKAYGLAGLRLGYLVASPGIAKKLNAVVMAKTNVLAIAAAQEALKDDEFYKYSIARNAEAKKLITTTLDELKLEHYPSHANFVFFRSGRPINSFIDDMMKRKIRIGRPFPPLNDWARVSTGTVEETNAFCAALKAEMG